MQVNSKYLKTLFTTCLKESVVYIMDLMLERGNL